MGCLFEPRQGHIDRYNRVVSHLAKFKQANIRISADELDFSSIPTTPCDQEKSVYGNVKEITPHDTPAPLANHVTTIIYHDANLCHNVTTGRSVTGVLHMSNKTHLYWHSKKESTVEQPHMARSTHQIEAAWSRSQTSASPCYSQEYLFVKLSACSQTITAQSTAV